MKKNIRYDEDMPYDVLSDSDDGEEEAMKGYAILGDDGEEMAAPVKSSEEFEDEVPEASEVPQNEQSVIFDNAKITGVKVGSVINLVIDGEDGILYYKKRKIGNLKQAFIKKILSERCGMYAYVTLQSDTVPYLVNIKYTEDPEENATVL